MTTASFTCKSFLSSILEVEKIDMQPSNNEYYLLAANLAYGSLILLIVYPKFYLTITIATK